MDRRQSFLQRKLRMTSLGPYTPEFDVQLGWGARPHDDYYICLPLKRSLPIILIAFAFLAAFSIPLFTVAGTLTEQGDDGLYSLVFLLFTAFWLLGWAAGVGLLLLVFLCVAFGQETLHVANNRLTLRIGLPGIGLGATYHGDMIRNFKYQQHNIDAGKKWRGKHIDFDYGSTDFAFGSALSESQAHEIIVRLQRLFPLHDAESPSMPLVAETKEAVIEISRPAMPMVGIEVEGLRWSSPSGIALIFANLIPLFAVLLGEWDIGEIMLLFWAESAIIGYYNVLKLVKIGRWATLFYAPFFVGHYGGFMAVHLIFIYALFSGEFAGQADVSQVQVLNDLIALWPALLGLLISHGISYYTNFVKNEAHKERSISSQMREPYKRIVIMHITLIIGAFLTLSLGSGVPALVLLLAMKIAVDLRSHLAQHSK